MRLLTYTIIWLACGAMSVGYPLKAQSLCTGSLAPNSIPGGDFGNGATAFFPIDPGYTPNMQYLTTLPMTAGAYTLAKSVNNSLNPCWLNTNDNSEDGGYMLVANCGSTPTTFLQRTIEVCDGLSYYLAVDLLNLRRPDCPTLPNPQVECLVGGVVVSTISLPADGQWQTAEVLITAPAGSSLLTIQLRSTGTDNLLAADNLRLQHCGPNIELPTTTTACDLQQVSITPSVTANNYSNPFYQWQQSFDGGTTWVNITGANAATLLLNNPNPGISYRVLIADGAANAGRENCRLTSNASRIEAVSPVEVFNTTTLCNGDTLLIGNETITEAGTYTQTIGGESGCDSLIHQQVFLLSSYDHLYYVSLCSGTDFEGQTFVEDTLLQQAFIAQNGCDSLVSIEIDVTETEDVQLLGDSVICAGTSTEIAVMGAYPGYQWNTGEATQSIQVDAPGLYTVEVTTQQGCTISRQLAVQQSQPFMDWQAEDTSCPDSADGTIEVVAAGGGVAPYQYSIAAGQWQPEPLFDGLEAGSYELNIQDARGCDQTEEIAIMAGEAAFGAEILGLPNSGAIDVGDTLHLSLSTVQADYTYTWSGHGFFSCENCPEVSWRPLREGRLSLEISSPSGCVRQIDTLVRVLDQYRIYFPNAFSPNGDGHNDVFTPGMSDNVAFVEQLDVYDRWGGHVYEARSTTASDPRPEWDGTRQGQALESGTYVYQAVVRFKNDQRKLFSGAIQLFR